VLRADGGVLRRSLLEDAHPQRSGCSPRGSASPWRWRA
jgi:hypothetical protein